MDASRTRARSPEPAERRTYQPVRRDSRPKGRCERWRPFDQRQVGRYLRGAERLSISTKAKGKRGGVLGAAAVRVLRELLRIIDFRTGRLEPAIATLMVRLRLSRTAVCQALRELKFARFIDWTRRLEPADTVPGQRGPQVKQATNAYEILPLPARAAQLAPETPPPVDLEHRRAELVGQLRAMETLELEDRVAARRASARGSASPLSGRNPAGGS